MDYLKVAETISNLGIMVIIAVAVIYLLVKYFSKIIDGKIKEEKPVAPEIKAIEYDSVVKLKELHPYFDKIDSIIKVKLPITKIGGPVRTKIFKDVLRIFYETQTEIINNLLDKNITDKDFLHENEKALNQIVELSTLKMKEYGIPEIVSIKFWEWNSKRHEYIASTLSDIDSSTVFKTVVEKQYAALNLYQTSSYFCLIDAEKTLKNLNGDLSGTIYRGEVIEGLHYGED